MHAVFNGEGDRCFGLLLKENKVGSFSVGLNANELVEVKEAAIRSLFQVVKVQIRRFLLINTLANQHS